MTHSILVVDDQLDLLDSIELTLESAGYQVLTASNGQEALSMLQSHTVDLILSDIAMSGFNGYQLYSRVRENPDWITIPFLFLTARGLDSDIRYGKELGVDDYLVKPIQPEDLLSSIQGKLKRSQQLQQYTKATATALDQHALKIGELTIDVERHRVWHHNELVQLAAREFVLLNHLAQRLDHVVSPHELIHVTHGLDMSDAEALTLLRPLIRSLRRKLGYAVGETGCIENVRGVGYRLIIEN